MENRIFGGVENDQCRRQLPCNRIGPAARMVQPELRGVPVGEVTKRATTAKTQFRTEPLELNVAEIGGHNTNLKVLCLDQPMQPNNACHLYSIEVGDVPAVTIAFQRGPVKENGINGVSNEALLAIVAHRFEGFQKGQFACEDNAEALEHIYDALRVMARRTSGRVLAQVEGYDKPLPNKG